MEVDGPDPSNMHFINIDADRKAWVLTNAIQKLAQFDSMAPDLLVGFAGTFPARSGACTASGTEADREPVPGAVGRGGVRSVPARKREAANHRRSGRQEHVTLPGKYAQASSGRPLSQ